MGERKVTNKYYPPDFDPSVVPKRTRIRGPGVQIKIRFMLPMSIQCLTCGEYMYRGKKFNAKKEDMQGPDGDYLGIRKYRFYLRCVSCCSEICIRTDPKNSDYIMERGASRNFEPWKQESEAGRRIAEIQRGEVEQDIMASLEERTKESKREMEVLDALQEIQDLNSRASKVDTKQILADRSRLSKEEEEKATQAEVDRIVAARSETIVKRLESGSSDSEGRRARLAKDSVFAKTKRGLASAPTSDGGLLGAASSSSTTATAQRVGASMPAPSVAVAVVVGKKRKKSGKKEKKKKKKKHKKRKVDDTDVKAEGSGNGDSARPGAGGIGGLLGAYGSSDSGT